RSVGGAPPRDDNGISAILDLQHVRALQQARDLHAALGEREHAERYDDLARRIRNSVIARCWDDERGLLADTPDKDTFSQHTNAFFILTAEQEARTLKAVARRMVDDDDLVEATLYFSYYVHRALIEAGLGD